MRARRDSLPSVEIDAQENGFREEREALERKRHTDDRAGEGHEARPQQPKLKGKHGARNRADREQNGGPSRPTLGEIEVHGFARPLPATLGDNHEHGHRDPDDGKDDVKRERHRHLRPGGEQIAHLISAIRSLIRCCMSGNAELNRSSTARAESGLPAATYASAFRNATRSCSRRSSAGTGNRESAANAVRPSCLSRTSDSIARSEEHTSELQSPCNLVCRLLLEKKK